MPCSLFARRFESPAIETDCLESRHRGNRGIAMTGEGQTASIVLLGGMDDDVAVAEHRSIPAGQWMVLTYLTSPGDGTGNDVIESAQRAQCRERLTATLHHLRGGCGGADSTSTPESDAARRVAVTSTFPVRNSTGIARPARIMGHFGSLPDGAGSGLFAGRVRRAGDYLIGESALRGPAA
jgi:hypothetical protein